MGLFNPRILKPALSSAPTPTAAQLEIAKAWAESIRNQSIFKHNESQIEGVFQSRIVEGLFGYQPFGGTGAQNYRPKQPMGKGIVDIALGTFKDDTRVIAPFELKGADTRDLDAPMAGRNKTPVQQAWEYANAVAGSKWVLVSNMLEIRLYGFGEGQQDYERIDLAKIDRPEELTKAQLLLSAENLLGTRLVELLRQSKAADKDISTSLYTDYNALRVKLIEAVNAETKGADKVQAVNTGQKILDRVLFIAFAEDRGLLPDRSIAKAFETQNDFNPQPVWQNFKGLFKAIDEGSAKLGISKYNGGLFKFDENVDGLNLSDEICGYFNEIGKYHFDTEVSITVLGHIFEQSVSDVEKLLAKARGEEDDEPEKATGVKGRRKRDGIVYTPDYIAKFIVEKTLSVHVEELFCATMAKHAKAAKDDYYTFKKGDEEKAWIAYRLALTTLRVVDPACGSGVFLVTAFDYLKAEYDRVNKKISELRGKSGQIDIEDVDREILSQNLYGVDVNAESVEITKLSLWLKTAKKGKELDSLDHNIRVGDSLIEDSSFAYLKHGFRWNDAFPEVFAAGGFDVVLGNPPYVRQELLKDMKPYLQKRFEVYHGVADLYCYFFERGLRLLKKGGRLGYISSSTFFKTSSGAALRAYLKKEAALDSVTDFGDLQIFEGVTTYPAILTMRKAPATATFKFWKVRAIPEGNFGKAFVDAAQDYPQDKLGAGSWELESDALRQLRDKIVRGKKTLKEVYGSPLYGIKTGLNEAFVIDRATRDRLIAEDPKSEELLKPWLEGKDLKRWQAEGRDLFLILMPKGWTKKQINTSDEVQAWNWLLDNRPAIANELAPFTERGRKRTDQGDFWWELRACDYYDKFEKPKIYYNDIMHSPSFLLDTESRFAANTAYFVQGDDRLLSYLNSNVFWFYFTAMSPAIRGGFSRLFTQYVNLMPIPNGLENNSAIVAKVALLISSVGKGITIEEKFARRIPDLCPPTHEPKLSTKLQDWWKLENFAAFRVEVKKVFKTDIPLKERSDWEDLFTTGKAEIEKLSAEIKRNEDEINRIVYELFDLTPEEIKLLETSIGAA
ncbi:MAG: N-6 DNA methylase [Pseudomonadota bacterium]|nr:N-6 DNA methylase [Pseudomonadota bacterium]